ncbi:hypothetical protein NW762_006887 [Fusarium torreyae]|uniref:Uncharacterized protein n=1 Tax=Fusarium torreyae TaxID=1237075 RepID=A0A9W8RYE2_9HYPO|nr:hypothetical protein NW762_006887 [Fusarium torreyae]
MAQRGFIGPQPPVIRLISTNGPKVEHLCEPVLNQLKADIGLSNSVETRVGAWKDLNFSRYIVRELKLARKKLQEGLSPVEAARWNHLGELKPEWANSTINAQETEPVAETGTEEWLDPGLQGTQPATITQVVSKRMELLREHHVEPDRLMNAQNRVGPRTNGGSRASDDEPFDLCDNNGVPLNMRVFTVQSGRKTVATATKEPDVLGFCGRWPRRPVRDVGASSNYLTWQTTWSVVTVDARVVSSQRVLAPIYRTTPGSVNVVKKQGPDASHFHTIIFSRRKKHPYVASAWVP